MAAKKPSADNRAPRPRRNDVPWAELPDSELLAWRMCDLELRIEGTILEERIAQLEEELAYRQLTFRPHYYLADEWFSPDGVPGIAIPFYLAHPRLMRLERKQMLEVEGGPEDWCLKILRHEAGHAIDTAYRLNRRGDYRQMFGRYAAPYPDTYKAKPYSKSFVLHLEPWYAQAHPAEDFAETFAVWLKPRSRWRSHYENWPAIKKLEYVDRLMSEIRGTRPKVLSREHVDSLKDLTKTLGEHYQQKRDRYGLDHPRFFDRDLRRLFSDAPEHAHCPSAAAFLRRIRAEIRQAVAHWTGEYQYTIDQVLREMIDRCRELKLRLNRPLRNVRRDALVMLTVQTMNYLHAGHHRLVL
ncbi:MAG TPA: putative zinc-binding metallopeptidase [Pirellulaceae bacterium]|nr:putative zinc-binding metallopeptidase [Pirellulaceae bacterium]